MHQKRKDVFFRREVFGYKKSLRHLWEETDGERQSQAEGGEDHQAVDGQDESPPSLQEREPGGTQRRQRHGQIGVMMVTERFIFHRHIQYPQGKLTAVESN